jgi:hypothetical protein
MLINLVEILSKKKLPKHNLHPRIPLQKVCPKRIVVFFLFFVFFVLIENQSIQFIFIYKKILLNI